MTAAAIFDIGHLERQTMGDEALKAEVLGLLRSQLAEVATELAVCDTTARASIAHRVKGAARGTGAFPLASAAEAVEAAPADDGLLEAFRQRISEVSALLAAGWRGRA